MGTLGSGRSRSRWCCSGQIIKTDTSTLEKAEARIANSVVDAMNDEATFDIRIHKLVASSRRRRFSSHKIACSQGR